MFYVYEVNKLVNLCQEVKVTKYASITDLLCKRRALEERSFKRI